MTFDVGSSLRQNHGEYADLAFDQVFARGSRPLAGSVLSLPSDNDSEVCVCVGAFLGFPLALSAFPPRFTVRCAMPEMVKARGIGGRERATYRQKRREQVSCKLPRGTTHHHLSCHPVPVPVIPNTVFVFVFVFGCLPVSTTTRATRRRQVTMRTW